MDRLSGALRTVPCPVKECGARVIRVEIGGEEVSLNPVWTNVAAPSADGHFAIVRGLQLHAQTCVNIPGRRGEDASELTGATLTAAP